MRHYIKTLAMLLMVSLGFVACNDTDDFDDYKVTYPTNVPLGYYHSEYTIEGDYEYGVMLTKNADDKTVLQLISEGKPYGNDSCVVRTLLATSDLTYTDSIGTMVAVDTLGYNFYEANMKVYLAYKMDVNHIVLAVEYGNKKFSSVLVPSQEAPAVASRWMDNNFIIDLKSVSEAGELPGTITFNAEDDNAEAEQITYSYDGKNGTFTVNGKGLEGTFSYNERYQLVVNVNGSTYTCDRTYSIPEPETFNQIAIGTYSHSIGVIEGGPVFTDVYEAGLFQSDKNPNNFIISPWLNNPDGGLLVIVNPETGKVLVPQQSTGQTHPQYGEIFALDVESYTGGQIPSKSYFDGKIFHLDLAYVVSAGYFGFVNETYEITDSGANHKKLSAVKNTLAPATPISSRLMKLNF